MGVVAFAIVSIAGVIAFTTQRVRGAAGRSAMHAFANAELLRGQVAANYTDTPERSVATATELHTPHPIPSGVVLAVTGHPKAIAETITLPIRAGTPQLAVSATVPDGTSVSGAIDLVNAVPSKGATIIAPSPAAVARP